MAERDAASCSSEFIYMQMRQICKARLMIGEDEFGGEKSRWVFKCSHSIFLPPPPKAHGLQAKTLRLPLSTDRSRLGGLLLLGEA